MVLIYYTNQSLNVRNVQALEISGGHTVFTVEEFILSIIKRAGEQILLGLLILIVLVCQRYLKLDYPYFTAALFIRQ